MILRIKAICKKLTTKTRHIKADPPLEKEISKIEFDIAILGCGAYGFPLAAYIKRKGKKAVHLGGSTQLLFGIFGKRWETSHFSLINKYWVRPAEDERPKNYKSIEDGCYW